jgi:hypothetical protein
MELLHGTPSDLSGRSEREIRTYFITKKMYTCTKDILSNLGQMYAGGGDFTTNIDGAGGEGTAQFASDAIEIYCGCPVS